METRLYRVTTTFLGADAPSKLYFDTREKAWDFYRNECQNGGVSTVYLSADYPLNYSDGCSMNDLTYGDFNATESDYEYVGKWQDTDIDVVEVDDNIYALYGNNGERYLHCWKCVDRFTADPDDQEYQITPVYDWSKWNEEDGEFQDAEGNSIDGIIGFEVL